MAMMRHIFGKSPLWTLTLLVALVVSGVKNLNNMALDPQLFSSANHDSVRIFGNS